MLSGLKKITAKCIYKGASVQRVNGFQLSLSQTRMSCIPQLQQQKQQQRHFATDKDKARAHEDLRDAVRELSGGNAAPISMAPVDTLVEWDEQPLDSLDNEQLEELARAWFDGVDGLGEDKERAFTLWTVAADRGSVESKYSRAVCLREGQGVTKQPELAFQTLVDLAEKDNYALAHVSTVKRASVLLFHFSHTHSCCENNGLCTSIQCLCCI